MKYVRRPVPEDFVEAFQWTADEHQTEDPEWLVAKLKDGTAKIDTNSEGELTLLIERDFGGQYLMVARYDFVVKFVNGAVLSMPEALFHKRYQEVENAIQK